MSSFLEYALAAPLFAQIIALLSAILMLAHVFVLPRIIRQAWHEWHEERRIRKLPKTPEPTMTPEKYAEYEAMRQQLLAEGFREEFPGFFCRP